MTETTIYALGDPRNGEIRYVGNCRDLKVRLRGHRSEARNPRFQTPKVRWLRSIGQPPRVIILETVPQSVGDERERYWIAQLQNDGFDLTNRQDGGRGGPRNHTEEAKSKMRAAALANGAKPPSQKGIPSWNSGLRGVLKPNSGSFAKGGVPWNKGTRMTHCKAGHDLAETGYFHVKRGRYTLCKKCRDDRKAARSAVTQGDSS